MPKNSSSAIILIREKDWPGWAKRQSAYTVRWCRSHRFAAAPDTHCVLPDGSGGVAQVLVGIALAPDIWSLASLPEVLPEGRYHLETRVDAKTADALLLGWLLGSYRFTRYRKAEKTFPVLLPPKGAHTALVEHQAEVLGRTRDLINTPSNDMGPAELARECREVAKRYKADYREIVGDDLIAENYPAIYEVGKASVRAPRLIDIHWGKKTHPKVTLVGKGVCFDSGGLDIKPSAGMRLMKKDMAGGACALGLARLIIKANLPVRLRVLIPAVENSISGNAYRPLDVINTRKGITVEIGNTDAEGRIILCDALTEADSEKPDLLLDFATLTGAARTALGTDLPALFTPDDRLAAGILKQAHSVHDPLWRLPLWAPYREMLKSAVADINSAPDSPYAGAITAALYLKEFVSSDTPWAHVDMMAWNLTKRPGRPIGAEAVAVRALFAYISSRFA